MTETIKLSEEEVAKIKEVQERTVMLKEELGAIGQVKLNMKLRQVQAEKFFSATIDLEKEITRAIEEKYGPGNVNLQTGEFIPAQKK